MQNFVVYKSGAGSGKTFTLVKEFLRLCLYDPKKLHSNYKRILAVTFTNKAAAEMKSRVIENLHQLSMGKMKGSGELLCEELELDASELKHRAETVLKELLHHYSDFSVSTIDSFTHRLVKTFAHDLKLPVNFEVELDEDRFFNEVVGELISRTGEDPYISKLLKEYVLLRSEENAAWDPELLIRNFSKLLHKENSGPYVDLLRQIDEEQLKTAKNQIRDHISGFYAQSSAIALKALEIIRFHGYTTNDFHHKSGGPQNYFTKIKDRNIKLKDADGVRLLEAIEHKKWFSDDGERDPEKNKVSGILSDLAKELTDFVKSGYQLFSLCRLIERQLYPLLLLKKIEEISRSRKDESRLVFISEFNQKLFELIQNEPTPFIYERLGERYRHFLLDEFQDTSTLQWQNMLPLIDHSLSGGWFSLVVGDGKQSIYRWRNANVKQFTRLPHSELSATNRVMKERENNLVRNFEERQLDKNYRSLRTVVSFNNALFSSLAQSLLNEESKKIYENASQINVGGEGGLVSVFTFDSKEESEDTHDINFKHVREQIHSSLNNGFLLSEICVLCRTNQQGHDIVHHLMQTNIPVVSSESLLLSYIPEVQVLLAFFRYLLNPDDSISAGLVINYLFQKSRISEKDYHLALEAVSQKASLFHLLRTHSVAINEKQLIRSNLFDMAIELSKSLQLNQEDGIAIRFFIDEINHFLQKENSNLSEFLNWWELRQNKASMIIPQSTNAVRVMTIHASKGLEFPVVIVPFCDWKIDTFRENWVRLHENRIDLPIAVVTLSDSAVDAGFEKEITEEKQAMVLDNLNLLYVAFTRAVARLHIITNSGGKNNHSVNSWILNALPPNMIEKSKGYFETGTPDRKQKTSKDPQTPAFPLKPLTFENQHVQFAVKPSYLYNSEFENAKAQGILLHWILSQIRTSDDLDQALHAGRLKGYFDHEQIPVLKHRLEQLMQHPQLSAYFKEALVIKNEAELVTSDGQILRPDRIVFAKNETAVIDYKSGKEQPEQHAMQIQAYARALHELGHSTVRKLLVYLEENKVIELN